MSKHKLFFRGIDQEKKARLMEACSEVIDLLREKLKLKRWECLLVVKTLHECFPVDDLFEEKGDVKSKP